MELAAVVVGVGRVRNGNHDHFRGGVSYIGIAGADLETGDFEVARRIDIIGPKEAI